jgi:hypothetical protein
LDEQDKLLFFNVIFAFVPEDYHIMLDFKYPERAEELLEYLDVEGVVYTTISTKRALSSAVTISNIFVIASKELLNELLLRFWPGIRLDEFSFYVLPTSVTITTWAEHVQMDKPFPARSLGVLYELHQVGDPDDLYLALKVDPVRAVLPMLQTVAQQSARELTLNQIMLRPLTLLG